MVVARRMDLADVGLEEVERLALRSHPAIRLSTPRTTLDASWLTIFSREIGPALLAAHAHACAGHVREIFAVDQQLDDTLNASEKARSIRLTDLLLSAMLPPRDERVEERYTHAVRQKTTPGHWACLHGIRCATFGLAPAIALWTYLYQEIAGDGAKRSPEEILILLESAQPTLRQLTEKSAFNFLAA